MFQGKKQDHRKKLEVFMSAVLETVTQYTTLNCKEYPKLNINVNKVKGTDIYSLAALMLNETWMSYKYVYIESKFKSDVMNKYL